jgi:hypothetical protein
MVTGGGLALICANCCLLNWCLYSVSGNGVAPEWGLARFLGWVDLPLESRRIRFVSVLYLPPFLTIRIFLCLF